MTTRIPLSACAGGTLVARAILQITAPGSQDATLADVGFTLKGTLTQCP